MSCSDKNPCATANSLSGSPFGYRLENDGFVLYSVGPNGIDEGGRNRDDPGSPEDSEADDLALHVPPLPPPTQ